MALPLDPCLGRAPRWWGTRCNETWSLGPTYKWLDAIQVHPSGTNGLVEPVAWRSGSTNDNRNSTHDHQARPTRCGHCSMPGVTLRCDAVAFRHFFKDCRDGFFRSRSDVRRRHFYHYQVVMSEVKMPCETLNHPILGVDPLGPRLTPQNAAALPGLCQSVLDTINHLGSLD